MLTDGEIQALARKFLASNYPEDCEILGELAYDSPDGMYFVANVRTEDPLKLQIGDGGFFVRRSTGRVYHLGSGQIEEIHRWISHYAENDDLGLEEGIYRLTVDGDLDGNIFARTLVEFGAFYAILEYEHGTVWTTWKNYDEGTVIRRLKTLPATFLGPTDCIAAVMKRHAQDSQAFRYEFAGTDRPRYSPLRSDYGSEDLGPRWE